LDPKNTELLSNLARSQHGAELYREALETYAKLLRLVPDSAQIQTDRGTAFAKLKRFDKAESAYEKAITLQPDYFLAWSNRGNLFSELRLNEQAIQSYEKALQFNPNYAETWTNFFGKNDRPEDKLEVKHYVLNRLKKKICNPNLDEIILQKQSPQGRKTAEDNLNDFKKTVVEKTKSLGLHIKEDLACI
jgi:tetratricopeptide (TPR) repeat protein